MSNQSQTHQQTEKPILKKTFHDIPLYDANAAAHMLKVLPSYRQKDADRWSSAMQIYKRMSQQDLGSHNDDDLTNRKIEYFPLPTARYLQHHRLSVGGRELSSAPVSTTASSTIPSPSASAIGFAGHKSLLESGLAFSCLKRSSAPFLSIGCGRNRSQLFTMSSIDKTQENDDQQAPRGPRSDDDKAADENHSPTSIDQTFKSETSTSINDVKKSSININDPLEVQALAAVHENSQFLRTICVSEILPRAADLIFLNVTTMENDSFCIELTRMGWRVTSKLHDSMNGDYRCVDLHTKYFRSINELLSFVSMQYAECFAREEELWLQQQLGKKTVLSLKTTTDTDSSKAFVGITSDSDSSKPNTPDVDWSQVVMADADSSKANSFDADLSKTTESDTDLSKATTADADSSQPPTPDADWSQTTAADIDSSQATTVDDVGSPPENTTDDIDSSQETAPANVESSSFELRHKTVVVLQKETECVEHKPVDDANEEKAYCSISIDDNSQNVQCVQKSTPSVDFKSVC